MSVEKFIQCDRYNELSPVNPGLPACLDDGGRVRLLDMHANARNARKHDAQLEIQTSAYATCGNLKYRQLSAWNCIHLRAPIYSRV